MWICSKNPKCTRCANLDHTKIQLMLTLHFCLSGVSKAPPKIIDGLKKKRDAKIKTLVISMTTRIMAKRTTESLQASSIVSMALAKELTSDRKL